MLEDRILFVTKILKFDDVTSRDQKKRKSNDVSPPKNSLCLETARPFTFRANLPNERRRDEIR
jgi:hypothetical protein